MSSLSVEVILLSIKPEIITGSDGLILPPITLLLTIIPRFSTRQKHPVDIVAPISAFSTRLLKIMPKLLVGYNRTICSGIYQVDVFYLRIWNYYFKEKCVAQVGYLIAVAFQMGVEDHLYFPKTFLPSLYRQSTRSRDNRHGNTPLLHRHFLHKNDLPRYSASHRAVRGLPHLYSRRRLGLCR